MIAPPELDMQTYGPRLGDTAYWLPYAEAALRKAGVAEEPLRSGFAGTYPTLVGPSRVVKLFGVFPGWRGSYEAERDTNAALDTAGLAVPRVVAHGSLYPDRDDDWPFLVFETLPGRAWREVGPPVRSPAVAAALGPLVRAVHALPPPATAVREGAWWAHAADGLQERWRRRGTLPPHLLEEVPAFVADYSPAPDALVHGDVTEDHVFVHEDRLTGVIDWGDAMVCDPHYDLAALHVSAFRGRRDLLGAFLDASGWHVVPTFPRHCLQVALLHRFDVLVDVGDAVAASASLDDLADRLWTPERQPLS